jgi:hypothetical protein
VNQRKEVARMRKIVGSAPSEGIAKAGDAEEMRAVQDLFIVFPAFSALKERLFVSNFSRIFFSDEKRCH